MLRSQIVYLEHTSQVLADNPLGDPSDRVLPVYLPPDYATAPNKHYPVIWVLAPFTSWGERMLNLHPFDENIVQRLDRLIRAGKAAPTILAFPDCFTRYGGNQYINSTAVGHYEDYLNEELIPFLDTQLRTLPKPDHRGVLGHSSGGYGALTLAMRHPNVFGAAACHAGDMFFEYAYLPDFPAAVRVLEQFDSIEDFLRSFRQKRERGSDWLKTLGVIAMSAFYSPNPDNPQGFDLPFDRHTGQLDDEVWQRWLACDPVRAATHHLEALRGLRVLYFDCGTRDEYSLFLGARLLHRTLEHHSIPHIYQEFDGGHRDINWRYDVSLPILTTALAAQGE